MVGPAGVSVAIGKGFAITVTEAVLVQPMASVPVTVYVDEAFIIKEEPLLTPPLQEYV